MQKATFFFFRRSTTFLFIHVLFLNSNVFFISYGSRSSRKSLRRSRSKVRDGGNCQRIMPNFSLRSNALEKKASTGSAQSLSFLICVINLLPLREKTKPSVVEKYHFENVSLSGSL